MSMTEAAALVGVSMDKVRRYIDEREAAGEPVAVRDRDEHGRPRDGAWRRPYRDSMEAWRDQRRGLVANGAAAGEDV